MNSLTDHQLMLAVRDGDVEKLGSLFERHHVKLYNFFLKQTCNCHTSEDLVQDVFLRILKHRHTYRGEGKFTTWMFSIAHNAKIDHYRKQKRNPEPLDEMDDISSQEPNPEEIVHQKDDVTQLHKALNRLSPEKREAIILSRFHNIRYTEIAQIMNCTVGSIKARIFRALRELSEIYTTLTGVNDYEM